MQIPLGHESASRKNLHRDLRLLFLAVTPGEIILISAVLSQTQMVHPCRPATDLNAESFSRASGLTARANTVSLRSSQLMNLTSGSEGLRRGFTGNPTIVTCRCDLLSPG